MSGQVVDIRVLKRSDKWDVVPCCFAGVKWVKSGVGSAMLLQHTRDRGRALREAPTYVCKRITHATSQTLAHHSSNTVRE